MLPFGAPPSTVMGAMPTSLPPSPDMMLQVDPRAIIQMLTEIEPTFEPKYPSHFDKSKVKKPKPGDIWATAKKEESKHLQRVNRMMDTVMRLRPGLVSGVFPSDKQAMDDGEMDPWHSSALIDDYNLLCSILASFDFNVSKRVLQRAQRTGAQTLEDFTKMMREEEIYNWANTGDMPLQMVEAKVLGCYGELWSRHMCDLDNPDYAFHDTMIDPTSVYPVYGAHGLVKMYRMMRLPVSVAFTDWGEPTAANKKKMQDKFGTDDQTTIITVCEYADEWYRAATIVDGIELLPVTEHRYGEVPFVGQGGPAGEPRFTDTGRAGAADIEKGRGGWWQSGPSDDWGTQWKLTSSIAAQQERHNQLEAVMARITSSIKNAENPALIITRDNLGSTNALPSIDRRPGMVNEIGMGESVQEVPVRIPPMDMQQYMTQVNQDKMTGSIPLGMYGQQTGSQQTGNSMSVASESGMDHITPWVQALETYHTRKMSLKIRQWRNFGHLTRFRGGEEKPFMVAVNKPSTNEELARELTPELIDAIGPRVNVTMTRIRVQELMQLANVAATALPMGITTRRRMAEKMGETDYDRLREEWVEEMEWEQMQADEQAIKTIKWPIRLKQWADAATDPEEKAMYMALLDYWMEQQTMQMQAQMMPQQPGMGGPPGGAPPMGTPSGMGGAPALPGSNTMNFAGLGAGPGVDGGQVGRPMIPGPPLGQF